MSRSWVSPATKPPQLTECDFATRTRTRTHPPPRGPAGGQSNPRATVTTMTANMTVWIETTTFFQLAIPNIVILLSFVYPSFITASFVGRNFGHLHLDGYTLANLTANLLTLAFLQGLYYASDTLSPQAFGAKNYREVGLLAIRGFVATLIVIVPMNTLLMVYLDNILQFLGQDPTASRYAWHFYIIYALSLPFHALYTIVWKFLSAQGVLLPLVICTLISAVVVLPLSLGLLVRSIGFLGGAVSIALFYVSEALSILLWLLLWKPHHPGTWTGLAGAWRDAMAWEHFQAYLLLGIGGMLSGFEWVYWEVLALIVGHIGVLPLSAHTVPTQVIWIGFMAQFGIGTALAIRMGNNISCNVRRAKQLVAATHIFSFTLFGMVTLLLYVYRWQVFRLFTQEPDVMDLCNEIWINVCVYFLILEVFATNIGVSIGLGLQWTLGMVIIASLWLIGMPTAYYFSVIRAGGLPAVWYCMWPPYVIINTCMVTAFVRFDWDAFSKQVRIREGLEGDVNDNGKMKECLVTENCHLDSGETLLLMESGPVIPQDYKTES